METTRWKEFVEKVIVLSLEWKGRVMHSESGDEDDDN